MKPPRRKRPTANQREGRRLARAGMVQLLYHGYYLVASPETNRWFEVVRTDSGLACNCRSHAVRRVKCAHIYAVEECFSMERRAERAREIAKGGQLRRAGDNSYLVASQTKPDTWYRVEDRGDGMACQCPDHEMRKSDCKHVQAIRIALGTGRAVLQLMASDSCPRCGARRPANTGSQTRRFECGACDWPRRDGGSP